ncbi:MAG: PAS domain S-box protein [Desulfobacteraceae bacterium]
MGQKPTYEELERRVRELEQARVQQQKAGQKLKEGASLLDQYQKIAHIGSFVWNLETDALTWSKNMYTIHGLSEEGFHGNLNKVSGQLIHPDDQAFVQSRIEQMIREKRVRPMEFRIIRADGEQRFMRADGEFEFDEAGKPIKCIGVHQDITERKQAEEALRKSEARVRTKLNAVLSPEGDIGDLDLSDILDTEAIQRIMDDFYRLTHIGVAVVDMKGEVLVATGWQDICTRFHRVHPETRLNCIQSDLELSRGVAPGSFKIYGCKNNMWDMATPIMVGGEHLGNLFLGQFFFEDEQPDYDAFRTQARQYGFDESEYLAALDRVPRWRRETVDAVMRFYAKFADLISTLSYSNLKLARSLEQRDQTEKALRESEHKYRLLVENAQDAIYVLKDGVITFANASASRITGYPLEEIVGRPLIEFLHPEDRAVIWQRYEDRLAGREVPSNYTLPIIHKSGRDVWLQINQVVVNWEGAPATLNIARDITVQHRAEEKTQQLLSAIEQAAEIIVITDREGNIQYVSPSFEKVTGYTRYEVRGQNPKILKSGVQDIAFYQELWETILSGRRWQGRMVNRRKDGSHYTEEASISPVMNDKGSITHFVAVKRDVTAEIETEERLAQAQKMESIGALAGGVAHDFNNILSPILIHSEMAMMELPEGSPLRMNLSQIFQAGERARDLVQQILTFARREESERIPLRASLAVKESIKFLRSTIPTTIDIRHDIRADRDTVLADPSQMQQIVMNLCTNAAHAMREKGGLLEIQLTDDYLGSEDITHFADLVPGHYLKMSVKDSGPGISPELMDKIFEPYFTTKEVGEGTGLGLAVTHGIVKQYDGDITVESEIGKGTTFHVLLPIEDAAISGTDVRPADFPKGEERILFVDDEQAAVDAIVPMLEKLGYRVTARTSSPEALEIFRRRPEAFDLVITDYTMPHMTGRELAQKVMDIRPNIPIILCTGFSEQIDEAKAKAVGIRAFVIKPIVMKEMAYTIREVLGV